MFDDIVVDLSSHASGDVGSPATKNYRSHREIVNTLDYTFYVRPRSIGEVVERRETIRVAPFVLTNSISQSWGEKNRTLQVRYDKGIDVAGPVPIAYLIWEAKEQDDLSDTRIMAFF